jgi:multidrug efflux pump subunit AcrB
MPQLAIKLRKQDLERWGFDPVTVLDIIRTAYQGSTVGQGYEANRVFPVMVILTPQSRQSLSQVPELPLRSPSGAYVRLKQIADIYESSGRPSSYLTPLVGIGAEKSPSPEEPIGNWGFVISEQTALASRPPPLE